MQTLFNALRAVPVAESVLCVCSRKSGGQRAQRGGKGENPQRKEESRGGRNGSLASHISPISPLTDAFHEAVRVRVFPLASKKVCREQTPFRRAPTL